jgi:hypothetical protein
LYITEDLHALLVVPVVEDGSLSRVLPQSLASLGEESGIGAVLLRHPFDERLEVIAHAMVWES